MLEHISYVHVPMLWNHGKLVEQCGGNPLHQFFTTDPDRIGWTELQQTLEWLYHHLCVAERCRLSYIYPKFSAQ